MLSDSTKKNQTKATNLAGGLVSRSQALAFQGGTLIFPYFNRVAFLLTPFEAVKTLSLTRTDLTTDLELRLSGSLGDRYHEPLCFNMRDGKSVELFGPAEFIIRGDKELKNNT